MFLRNPILHIFEILALKNPYLLQARSHPAEMPPKLKKMNGVSLLKFFAKFFLRHLKNFEFFLIEAEEYEIEGISFKKFSWLRAWSAIITNFVLFKTCLSTHLKKLFRFFSMILKSIRHCVLLNSVQNFHASICNKNNLLNTVA